MDSTHYKEVPKDYQGNLEYRAYIAKIARNNRSVQDHIKKICVNDPLWFINTFVWLYEPRPSKNPDGTEQPKVIPFITWPKQDESILTTEKHIGYDDIGITKSRGEGGSWMAIAIFWRRFLFFPFTALGLVSRNENAVDSANDSDSLMWKLDFQVSRIPAWMRPPIDRNVTKHVMLNLQNNSMIAGYAATGDVGTGGRKFCFLMDELSKFKPGEDEAAMSSTGPVTDSRLIISTPKGSEGAYAKAIAEAKAGTSNMVLIDLDWKDNPTRNKGLYKCIKGKPIAMDHVRNPLPEDFVRNYEETRKMLERRGYLVEGTIRSPWYDRQCLRPRATPKTMAQEYDKDFGGSVSRFFTIAAMDRLLDGPEKTVKEPMLIGDLRIDPETFKPSWYMSASGRLRLWIALNIADRPPMDEDYIVGGDICTGAGETLSSNSVLSVIIKRTGQKVAEFSNPRISPEDLATYAVGLCKFFRGKSGDALLIWEQNGPGVQFKKRIFDIEFGNVWYRSATDVMTKQKTKKPGWWSTKKNKRELLAEYNYALTTGNFINPCKEALEETKQYQQGTNDDLFHVSSKNDQDPSGANDNHGDRVIADALAHWARQETGAPQQQAASNKKTVFPEGSYGHRRELHLMQAKKKKLW